MYHEETDLNVKGDIIKNNIILIKIKILITPILAR